MTEAVDVYFSLTDFFGENIPEVSETALILLTSDQLVINFCIKAGKYFDVHETEDYGREKGGDKHVRTNLSCDRPCRDGREHPAYATGARTQCSGSSGVFRL